MYIVVLATLLSNPPSTPIGQQYSSRVIYHYGMHLGSHQPLLLTPVYPQLMCGCTVTHNRLCDNYYTMWIASLAGQTLHVRRKGLVSCLYPSFSSSYVTPVNEICGDYVNVMQQLWRTIIWLVSMQLRVNITTSYFKITSSALIGAALLTAAEQLAYRHDTSHFLLVWRVWPARLDW